MTNSSSLDGTSGDDYAFVWDARQSYVGKWYVDEMGTMEIDFQEHQNLEDPDDTLSDIPSYIRKMILVHDTLSSRGNWALLNQVYQELREKAGAKTLIIRFKSKNYHFDGEVDMTDSPTLKNPYGHLDTILESTGKYTIAGLPLDKQAKQLAGFVLDSGLYYFNYYDNNELSDIFNIPQDALKWYEERIAQEFQMDVSECLEALEDITDKSHPVEYIIFENAGGCYPVSEREYDEASSDNPIATQMDWYDFCDKIENVFKDKSNPFVLID